MKMTPTARYSATYLEPGDLRNRMNYSAGVVTDGVQVVWTVRVADAND
jgi:hypothetical protein